ncbi:hypothetical protein OHS59_07545 [Streptomyces sp. NBC_00414]|uniref:hypothetical protein n=1 Tax=Streptomyces sp. NBC_00414 TaxID=2975739 RepID=UPI002E1A41EA
MEKVRLLAVDYDPGIAVLVPLLPRRDSRTDADVYAATATAGHGTHRPQISHPARAVEHLVRRVGE